MTATLARQCSLCGGSMVSSFAVAPYHIYDRQTLPMAHPVIISACPTCDRPKCNNAGCGLPTGPLLPLGQRELVPQTCDHCKQTIVYKGPRP